MVLERRLPEPLHKIFAVDGAELTEGFGAEERLRKSPAGVDRSKSLEPAQRRTLVKPFFEGGVEFERAFERQQEHLVEMAGARRAAQRGNGGHHVGILRTPLIGLAS